MNAHQDNQIFNIELFLRDSARYLGLSESAVTAMTHDTPGTAEKNIMHSIICSRPNPLNNQHSLCFGDAI